MYLSKISLRSLPASVHRLVMRGFPSTEHDSPRAKWGILYRVEPSGVVLVQSAIEPDWSAVAPPESVSIRLLSPKINIGQVYAFRIAINPVVVQRGRRVPVPVEDWLAKRDLGAELDIAHVDYSRITDTSGDGHRVTLSVARVEGVLKVADTGRLQEVLTKGVGKSRAYGCGMLSIAPTLSTPKLPKTL